MSAILQDRKKKADLFSSVSFSTSGVTESRGLFSSTPKSCEMLLLVKTDILPPFENQHFVKGTFTLTFT